MKIVLCDTVQNLNSGSLRHTGPPHFRVESFPYMCGRTGPGSTGKESILMKKAFPILEDCVKQQFGTNPIYLREGGSIPIIRDLQEVAGLEALMLGLFTNEDNLHAPDESFNLQIMERSIDAFEKFFLEIGK